MLHAKLLKDATAAEIIVYAAKLGHTFTIEDVLEIKRGSSLPLDLSNETVAEAVENYLSPVEQQAILSSQSNTYRRK